LKFLCIRSYFIGSNSRTRWTKGKYYNGREPRRIEKAAGIEFYIESNDIGPNGNKLEYFVKKKEYNIYFKSIEDVREEKLNIILDVRNNNDNLVSRDTNKNI